MHTIHLITIPFASLNMASLSLALLKSVVEKRCNGRVRSDILYLNL